MGKIERYIELEREIVNKQNEQGEIFYNLSKEDRWKLSSKMIEVKTKYLEAVKLIEQMAKNYCGMLCNSVKVIHEEGTILSLEYAYAEKYENWWFIYTEHHGNFVYDENEVNVFIYKRQFKRELELMDGPQEEEENERNN